MKIERSGRRTRGSCSTVTIVRLLSSTCHRERNATRKLLGAASITACLILAACSDDSPVPIDAAIDSSVPDAVVVDGPRFSEACWEFADPKTTIATYPSQYEGDLATAEADLQVDEGECAEVYPFTYTPRGGDDVIALRDLTPGWTYRVTITATHDISFYLARECSGDNGPGVGECLLFVDEADYDASETGVFVGPDSGELFLVVDSFYVQPPMDGTYTVDIIEYQCEESRDCTDSRFPHCLDRQCVECINSFDCSDANAPACDGLLRRCVSGFGQCVSDDGHENNDDGPAGATEMVLMPGSPALESGAICSRPVEELDYYRFTLDNPGDVLLTLTWSWTGAEELDVLVLADDGTVVGFSPDFGSPKQILLSGLASGTYYALIQLVFPAQDMDARAYDLSVELL